MTSQEFKNTILIKSPHYANSRIPLIQLLANKGSKKSEYSQFGPIYELYIYAFMLGIKKNLRLPLPPRSLTTEFAKIGTWKRDSSLVDFLLMIVFTRSEEIGFEWNDLEEMEDAELNSVISKIIVFIEEYANGGLEYLHGLLDKGELENSHYMFIDLYKENLQDTISKSVKQNRL
ncbi:MAG: hypothetical protein GW772_13020 [Flavobacteriia bacterium]|nr:hypothetical protein [Flavobacteriia bacterium]OIP46495.1 MAG: hypothetical protein AUK46_08100 [Flavobacteriaceae bacterium CG2_30_31_66]PIV97016.1 MAG: hypothetical protein COW43_05235 [Flavobacteriaceae bacterium CG17_big_fil_post_rev_8_21_14_2_50_31_13]PIX15246.1 MAG: hypothetical protein COZ74_00765 [Flavobacteriaceae bacterium CG_4_8_14_3_um_filter_31_8]PIY16357.1 MAG: hypothetical protein COZ16_00425 [Flavobacteriaceae bacterium CG_4_10_14_3_um_filter_31_253]PIZ12232.1 MAG: hypotheti